jgi:hypothetical protein
MQLDIRMPIGMLFTLLGLLLIAYGIWSDPSLYQRSLGININLWWGAVMLGFGALMLLLSRKSVRELFHHLSGSRAGGAAGR